MRIALALVALAGTAHADERGMTMALGYTGVAQMDGELDAQAEAGPRLMLSWEDPPLDYPDRPDTHYGGSLVPELLGGVMFDDHRSETLLGAGLRAELKVAQRERGPLRITYRGSAYLAARGMVIGANRDPLFEAVVGEYFQLQSGFRFGFDVGFAERWGQTMTLGDRAGVIGQVYFGWGNGGVPMR